MIWPYDTTTGSDQNLTLMLGEAVTNSRHTLRRLDKIEERIDKRLDHGEQRMDFLEQENIRRQSDHDALKTKVDTIGPSDPVQKHWLTSLPEWMETGGEILKALASVREWMTWVFLTTGAYKVITSPIEAKRFVLWILGLDHH